MFYIHKRFLDCISCSSFQPINFDSTLDISIESPGVFKSASRCLKNASKFLFSLYFSTHLQSMYSMFYCLHVIIYT